jgi:hypothetical protein
LNIAEYHFCQFARVKNEMDVVAVLRREIIVLSNRTSAVRDVVAIWQVTQECHAARVLSPVPGPACCPSRLALILP